jgi:hypothetical protein
MRATSVVSYIRYSYIRIADIRTTKTSCAYIFSNQDLQETYMNTSHQPLRALVDNWLGKISPTLIVVLLYIYSKALDCPDGKVSETIEDIAAATGLAWGTVQIKLRELANLKAIEILSASKKRTLIQIPTNHSLPTRQTLPTLQTSTADDHTMTSELIPGLCGQGASPEMLAIMMNAADDDELRLQQCLDNFRLQAKRWATLELLIVAVQNELRPHAYFDEYWRRP